MPERQDDHCPRGQQLRQHVNQKDDVFLCRGPHLARDCPDRNKPTGKGSKGPKENMKGKKGSGGGKGLSVVTIFYSVRFVCQTGSRIREQCCREAWLQRVV